MDIEHVMVGGGFPVVTARTDDMVRLAQGIAPNHLALETSDDGQYLLIRCGAEVVAMIGAMGGSPDTVHFADGTSYFVESLLDVVAHD